LSELDYVPFRVTRDASDDGVVLQLSGELDVSSAPVLDEAVAEMRPITSPLTIDVAGLTFVDSAGLRALTALRRVAIEESGATVTLARCPESLRRLLALSGLADAFGVSN
jgi:anti-sigma B factor antagonist